MFAPGAQTDQGAKTETRQQEGHARKFRGEKIERGTDVILFPEAVIVHAGAESRAAKIKSQNRNAESIDRLRYLVNHFVVHGAAKERMRVADDRGEWRMWFACWRPQNRFKTSCGSLQKEIARVVWAGHRCAMNRFAV